MQPTPGFFAQFLTVPASIPSPPSPILLSLGALTIRWYAVWILLGMAVAIYWTSRRWKARGGDPEVVWDLGIWICLIGIAGARVMAVLSYPGDYFGPGIPWWKPLAIWEGGLAIYGGLIGGLIGIVLLLRHRHLPVGVFLDSLVPTVFVAQALGRLGNYFNQEVYGEPTTLPWGLEIDPAFAPAGTAPGTLFHPTFLYEILWNLLAMGILLAYESFRKRQGGTDFATKVNLRHTTGESWGRLGSWELLGGYLFLYSLGRFFLEFVRIDYQYTVAGGVRWFQVVAAIVLVAGLVVLVTARRLQLPAVITTAPKNADAQEALDPTVAESDSAATQPGTEAEKPAKSSDKTIEN